MSRQNPGLSAPVHQCQDIFPRQWGWMLASGIVDLILAALIIGSGSVDIRRNAHPDPPDRYGRTLARVLVDGEDVACVLIKEGYARQWTGRREDRCTSLDERKPAEATLTCAATY